MSMTTDTELDTWRREWQSEAAVPPDLRRRVERQSRWLKIGIAADVMVTAAIGGGVVALAARAPHADMLLLAAATAATAGPAGPEDAEGAGGRD